MQLILPFTFAVFTTLTHTATATPTSQLLRRADTPVFCKEGVLQNEDFDMKNVICERSGCDGGSQATQVRMEDNSLYWTATCTNCPKTMQLINGCYEGTPQIKAKIGVPSKQTMNEALTKSGDPELNPPTDTNTTSPSYDDTNTNTTSPSYDDTNTNTTSPSYDDTNTKTNPTSPKTTNDPYHTDVHENGTDTSDTNPTTPKTNPNNLNNENGTDTNVPMTTTTSGAVMSSSSLPLVTFMVAMFTILMV